ncbi:response regulator transcription factor [Pseudoalteromonas sp. MMG012]|uniref:response regulator transcription factor n=1 Tax=Pseudoalteromonas sp. MMG012 TaxID=2822686 RepID=UPI001B3A6B7E|nr:response regulator transcription factor [Pseudoalteromonas sp. MMG012]MBQ4852205.1 response regulator transcription factor [Pseudoalteromonas sp. MMG012]
MKVLIVEDDKDLSLAISDYLEMHGAECDFAYDGKMGVELSINNAFDCIILDLMLPKIHGFDVCKTLRDQGCLTPILMLTACDTDEEQLMGFAAGLDDYVTKPCHMSLLWARLQALHRRNNPILASFIVGDLSIFPKEHRAMRADTELKLTPTGWRILEFLARNSPQVVTKTQLEEHIWPHEDVETGTLNVHLHQLRKVVDKPFPATLIHTHVGVGLSLREATT